MEANDVAIATHGRGFYILDDVAPLRQYGAPATRATDAYLFKPGDAIRDGDPAQITYWLKKPPQKLTLEILDGRARWCARSTARRRWRAGGRRARRRLEAREGWKARRRQRLQGNGGGRRRDRRQTPADADAAPRTRKRAADADAAAADGVDGGRRAALHLGSAVCAGDVTFPGMVLWGATTNGPMALPGTYQARLTVDGRARRSRSR